MDRDASMDVVHVVRTVRADGDLAMLRQMALADLIGQTPCHLAGAGDVGITVVPSVGEMVVARATARCSDPRCIGLAAAERTSRIGDTLVLPRLPFSRCDD